MSSSRPRQLWLPLGQILIWTLMFWMGWGWIGSPSAAQPSTTPSPKVQAHLISEQRSIAPDTPFWVGVRMRIQDGWHTYWKNPGDSGAPTRLDWDLPEGFSVGEIQWPYPHRLPVGPLVNYGYEDQTLLLLEITPPPDLTQEFVTLSARADWLVCHQECLPESADLSLDLPVILGDPAPNPIWSRLFDRTRQDLPLPSPWSAVAEVGDDHLQLSLSIPELSSSGLADRIQAVTFFPDQGGVVVHAADQELSLTDQGLSLKMERGFLPQIETVSGVVVIQEQLEEGLNTQALAIDAPVQVVDIAALETPDLDTAPLPEIEALSLPLSQILLLALLGGMTLNLMPCVFPILSLKALSVAQKARYSAAEVRRLSLVFTAGILVSMGLLGGVLLGLKALGHQIGWGFQLQSPGFVLGLAYLLLAVALSLGGLFQIGASWMGVGQGLTADQGYRGEFFTGMLTTVMSTPCTAPFMATAVGAALAQPPWVSLMILQMLGIGLALPYLILGFIPQAHGVLPRPGAWMETLQQFLAFPMLGTVAWLIWVLAQQAGSGGLALALTGVILVAFAIWTWQKTQGARLPWRRIGRIVAGIAVVIALGLTQGIAPQGPQLAQLGSPIGSHTGDLKAPAASSGIAWEPYSEARLSESIGGDQPVFVNFSAAWCVTCLVNDRVALSRPEVVAAFAQHQVIPFKADWTHQDAQITQALRRFGRSGVPLYVFYPGPEQDPLILPQVLTPAIVIESLQSAGSE